MNTRKTILTTITSLALVFSSSALHSEVEQVCIDRFQANGAFPGNEDCQVLAVTSRAGLNNFACTGPRGEEIIAEYCGLTDEMECRFDPVSTPVTNTGSVSFSIEPESSVISPSLLQLFLLTNPGLLTTLSDTDSADAAIVLAAIFGLSLNIVAASDDLPNIYSDYAPNPLLTGDLDYCP